MSADISLSHPHHVEAANTGASRSAGLIALVTVVLIVACYYRTAWSMVSIWERSDTFAHCFLIVPISAWLIWRQRGKLAATDHKPNPWGLLLLAGLGFGWLLAALAHVLVFQQYFMTAMIPAAAWAILGNRMTIALGFPLAYLLLAVPFGEVLIPSLIDLTANFTVNAVRLTGIPIYREGTYFALPSGNWSVVEACSGLRYLIASFTLGTLFAYLTYRSLKRRLVFIAVSLILPLFANGVRAYLIVMMGHLSGMRLAVGADHLVYGWAFFGLVMLLLFWIGSAWREDGWVGDETEPAAATAAAGATPLTHTAAVAVAAAALAMIWPAYAGYLEHRNSQQDAAAIDVAGLPGKWEASAVPVTNWRPAYIGNPLEFQRTFAGAGGQIHLHIAKYHDQRPGSQLVTSANLMVSQDDKLWRDVGQQTRIIELDGRRMTVTQNRLHSPDGKLLIWRWYQLGGEETASPYIAKIILAKHKLFARGDDGAEVMVAARYDDRPETAAAALESFLEDMAPAIRKGVLDATGR
jgi:exosortase A